MQQLLQIARQGREMWGRVAMIEELLESCRSLIQARYSLQNLGPRQLSTNAETLRCVERQLAETGRELRRVSAQGGLPAAQSAWVKAMARSLGEIGF